MLRALPLTLNPMAETPLEDGKAWLRTILILQKSKDGLLCAASLLFTKSRICRFIDNQLQLEADAREVLPYVRHSAALDLPTGH